MPWYVLTSFTACFATRPAHLCSVRVPYMFCMCSVRVPCAFRMYFCHTFHCNSLRVLPRIPLYALPCFAACSVTHSTIPPPVQSHVPYSFHSVFHTRSAARSVRVLPRVPYTFRTHSIRIPYVFCRTFRTCSVRVLLHVPYVFHRAFCTCSVHVLYVFRTRSACISYMFRMCFVHVLYVFCIRSATLMCLAIDSYITLNFIISGVWLWLHLCDRSSHSQRINLILPPRS